MKQAFLILSFVSVVFSYAPWLEPETILAYDNNYIADVMYVSGVNDSQSLVLERDSITQSFIMSIEYHGDFSLQHWATSFDAEGNWLKTYTIDYELDSINGDTIMEYERIYKNDTLQLVKEYPQNSGDTVLFIQKFDNGKILSSADTNSSIVYLYKYDSQGYLDSAIKYNSATDSVEFFRWYDFDNGKLIQYGISGDPQDVDETHRILIYENDKLTGSIHMKLNDTVMLSRYRYADVNTPIKLPTNANLDRQYNAVIGSEIKISGDMFHSLNIYDARGSLLYKFRNYAGTTSFSLKNSFPKGLLLISIDNGSSKLKLLNNRP